MAFPAWASAAIAGGASIGGTIIGASATQKANHDARNFALMAYDLEKEDAQKRWLQETEWNEKMWHLANQYNSPMAQMERFKEAGLNPNLIYGQNNSSPGIATARFDKPGTPKWKPDVPNFDLNAGIMATINARESSARTDNLRAQNDVLKQEAIKKAAETAGVAISNARSDLELEKGKKLFDVSVDAAIADLNKTKVETDVTIRRDEREAAMNASNLREAAQRIMNLRGQNYNQALDAVLKKMDIELKKEGLQPGDPSWMRILFRLLNGDSSVPGAFNNLFDYNYRTR